MEEHVSDVLIDQQDGVLSITWNRPDALNALTPEMLNAAAQAVEDADESVRLVLVTGVGRAFSSGAALGGDFDGAKTLEGANRLVRALTSTPRPVLAGVNGLAAGVGASIAFAADLAVAKSSSYFLLAFVNIGLMPDGGATELVAASIGRARANRLAMLGQKLPATEAEGFGLIHAAVDDDAYDAELAELTQKLAGGPTKALAAMKEVITANTLPRLDATLDAETAGQVGLFDTADAIEGGTAFLQKRRPAFTGR
jgi:enoyl-CoA hydratase